MDMSGIIGLGYVLASGLFIFGLKIEEKKTII